MVKHAAMLETRLIEASLAAASSAQHASYARLAAMRLHAVTAASAAAFASVAHQPARGMATLPEPRFRSRYAAGPSGRHEASAAARS